MGPKRKHQPVEQESDNETPKSKTPKKESKKKRAKKNKNDSIVKEEFPIGNVQAEDDVDIKPDLNNLDSMVDEENQFGESYVFENNDTTVASEDGGMLEPKIEQDLPTWPTKDLETLLSKIEEMLPEKDNLRFKSRLAKLDWETLRFADYSSDQCRQMWEFAQKHVRCYRLLGEIISDAKVWLSHPWTSYRNHKKKPHPEMPRRPLSCYMIYYMRNKTKVLKKNPKMDMPSLSKHISEMYKKLPQAKKEKYMKMAEVQRDEYMEKLREFYKKHPELEPISMKQKMLALNVPKKPFKLYYDSKLKDADDKIDRNLFLKKCKRKWKNLSDEKKFYWIDLALSQTDTNTNADTGANDEYKKKMQNLLTKEERHLKEKIAGKPDKPPTSAYGLFSRNLIATERIQAVNPKDRIATIAQEWKKCSNEEKEAWKQKLVELIEKYKQEYTAYLESLTEEERIFELLNNQPKGRKKKSSDVDETPGSPEAINSPPSPVDASTSKTIPVPEPSKTSKKKKQAKQKLNTLNNQEIENPVPVEPSPKVSTTHELFMNEPEPPPSKPIDLFAKKLKNTTKVNKSVEDLWEDLSIKEKEGYRKKLDKLKNTYIVKYEAFLKSLTPEQLKQYSKMKNTPKGDESGSDSESDDEDDSDDDSEEEEQEDDEENHIQVKQEPNESEADASSSSEDEDDSDDDSSD